METPLLTVTRVSCRPTPGSGDGARWQATCVLRNAGAAPLTLEAAWIPHGRFRGDGRLPLSGQIGPGATREVEFSVTAEGAAGTVVENAFLILRVRLERAARRVFVRMRIEFDSAAVPEPVVETITTQCLE